MKISKYKIAYLIYGLDNSIIFWLEERLSLFQTNKRMFRYYEKNISTQQSEKGKNTWL